MTPQMQRARMLSARLKRLLKAKQEVGSALYVYIAGDIFLEQPLQEFLGRLEGKILTMRIAIKGVIESIPGYQIGLHKEVDYLSEPDLQAGLIDISLEDDETAILDLETGEIVSNTNRPKKYRHRLGDGIKC